MVDESDREAVAAELILDEQWLPSLADRLATRGVLGAALARPSVVSRASVHVIVPEGVLRTPPIDRGGVMSSRAARLHLCRRLREGVEAGGGDTILARHSLARPGDPFLQDRPTAFVFAGEEVYGVAQEPFRSGQIDALVRDCETAEACSFAVGRYDGALRHGQEVTRHELERFAVTVSLAAIDVFHGESYALFLFRERDRTHAE